MQYYTNKAIEWSALSLCFVLLPLSELTLKLKPEFQVCFHTNLQVRLYLTCINSIWAAHPAANTEH